MSKSNQVYDAILGLPGGPQYLCLVTIHTQKLIIFIKKYETQVLMASIPTNELEVLSKMDDYDKMLAMDRVSRKYGVSVANIEKQLSALKNGKMNESIVSDNFSVPSKNNMSLTSDGQEKNSPTYLQNANKFRMKYDPSEQSMARQAQVNQAILCPDCSAPLGIPSIRPIKINCPNCLQEFTFYN